MSGGMISPGRRPRACARRASRGGGRSGHGAAIRLVALLAFLAALPAVAAPPAPFIARCVGVLDGDTIEVLRDGTTEKVRLEGIDAPERGQAFSARARERLGELAFGEEVRVEPRGTDRYGRWIARVKVGGVDVSEALVREGLAWHFVRYSSDETLARLERAARREARGLWVETRPMAPWTYREIARERARRAEPGESVGPYHGNVRSRVFHQRTCQHYHCKNCVAELATREEALEAGYRPCGICRP